MERRENLRRDDDALRRSVDDLRDSFLIYRSVVDQHAAWLRDLGVEDMSKRQRGLLPVVLHDTDIKVSHEVNVTPRSQFRVAVIVGIMSSATTLAAPYLKDMLVWVGSHL